MIVRTKQATFSAFGGICSGSGFPFVSGRSNWNSKPSTTPRHPNTRYVAGDQNSASNQARWSGGLWKRFEHYQIEYLRCCNSS